MDVLVLKHLGNPSQVGHRDGRVRGDPVRLLLQLRQVVGGMSPVLVVKKNQGWAVPGEVDVVILDPRETVLIGIAAQPAQAALEPCRCCQPPPDNRGALAIPLRTRTC